MPDNFPEFPFTGWILEDFLETAAQAELLEKGLSGYDPLRHVASRWDVRRRRAAAAKPTPWAAWRRPTPRQRCRLRSTCSCTSRPTAT